MSGHPFSLPEIALSVRQPWAWALIYARKDIENRGRWIRLKAHPQRLAIHAAQGMTQSEYGSARAYIKSHCGIECPPPAELVRGGIIGAVDVLGVTKRSTSPWFMGPYGLMVDRPLACEPIPAAGALGYFTWEQSGDLKAPLAWMRKWGAPPSVAPASTQGALL